MPPAVETCMCFPSGAVWCCLATLELLTPLTCCNWLPFSKNWCDRSNVGPVINNLIAVSTVQKLLSYQTTSNTYLTYIQQTRFCTLCLWFLNSVRGKRGSHFLYLPVTLVILCNCAIVFFIRLDLLKFLHVLLSNSLLKPQTISFSFRAWTIDGLGNRLF